MSKFVNLIPEGSSMVEPYHHPSGFIKPGEKIPTTEELTVACEDAARLLAPAMEKLLQEREQNAGD